MFNSRDADNAIGFTAAGPCMLHVNGVLLPGAALPLR